MSDTEWIVVCVALCALALAQLVWIFALIDRAKLAEASRDHYVRLADRRREELDTAAKEREHMLRQMRLLSARKEGDCG